MEIIIFTVVLYRQRHKYEMFSPTRKALIDKEAEWWTVKMFPKISVGNYYGKMKQILMLQEVPRELA